MIHHPSPLLLSRVAESAYWAGRYLARAEGTARLVKTHADLVVDLPRDATVGWGPLLDVLGFEEGALDRGQPSRREEAVLAMLMADRSNPSSVRSAIAAVHRNLRVVRAVLPIEAVEILTELHHEVEATAEAAIDRRNRGAWLTRVIRASQTLSSVLNDTMTHDDAFGFFSVGRQLERAELTTRVLDVQRDVLTRRVRGSVEPYVDLCWFAALRSVSALQPFRRAGIPASAQATVAFLLCNTKSPQSVEYCLLEAARWLLEIPGHEEAMAACAAVQRQLQGFDMDALVDGDLHGAVDDLQRAMAAVHDRVTATWFAPTVADMQH